MTQPSSSSKVTRYLIASEWTRFGRPSPHARHRQRTVPNPFGQDGLIGLASTGGLGSALFCTCWLGSGSFIAFLKSLIALPSAPPTSPSLLGPKMIRMITKRTNKWEGAKISMVISTRRDLDRADKSLSRAAVDCYQRFGCRASPNMLCPAGSSALWSGGLRPAFVNAHVLQPIALHFAIERRVGWPTGTRTAH